MGVEINAFFMILNISVSDLCFFYESLWSKFSLGVIFSKCLDGINMIKEKAPKHQTR